MDKSQQYCFKRISLRMLFIIFKHLQIDTLCVSLCMYYVTIKD